VQNIYRVFDPCTLGLREKSSDTPNPSVLSLKKQQKWPHNSFLYNVQLLNKMDGTQILETNCGYFLTYIPYFEKINGGLYDHLAVYASVCPS
jgi:hypothetical protein